MSRCILLVAMLTAAIQAQNNECNAKFSKQQCIRNNKTPQCQYGHELCCSWCTSTDTLDNLCFGQKSAKKLNTSNWSCDKTSQTETNKFQLDTKLEITSPAILSSSSRTVMAWTVPNNGAAAQLRNTSWANIFDGVQAGGCGIEFYPDGSGMYVNVTKWNGCLDLHKAVREKGGKFNAWIGAPPAQAIINPTNVLRDALALAKSLDLDGFSIDDETDCSPRSTLERFENWMTFINIFSNGLHAKGLTLSAAVQAMFGIQDVPYKPLCTPPQNPSCSQACNQAPYAYPNEPKVIELMNNSTIDRFLEMDTYYFGTARFLGALDWYTENVALNKLGVAVMNRKDISAEGLVARFHAIEKSKADWINVFLLPANDEWLPYLKRWKTSCVGCGVNTVLGCYDLSVDCGNAMYSEL